MAIITAETTRAEKVYNLSLELLEAKKDKKETVKAHSDNIKRIQDEINDLLDEDDVEAQVAKVE